MPRIWKCGTMLQRIRKILNPESKAKSHFLQQLNWNPNKQQLIQVLTITIAAASCSLKIPTQINRPHWALWKSLSCLSICSSGSYSTYLRLSLCKIALLSMILKCCWSHFCTKHRCLSWKQIWELGRTRWDGCAWVCSSCSLSSSGAMAEEALLRARTDFNLPFLCWFFWQGSVQQQNDKNSASKIM